MKNFILGVLATIVVVSNGDAIVDFVKDHSGHPHVVPTTLPDFDPKDVPSIPFDPDCLPHYHVVDHEGSDKCHTH